jgi:hypothetical protein
MLKAIGSAFVALVLSSGAFAALLAANYGLGANINNGRCVPSNIDCYTSVPNVLSGMSDQVAAYLANGPKNIDTTLFMLQGGANEVMVMVMNMPNLSRTPFGAGSQNIHDAVVAVPECFPAYVDWI